LGGRKKTGGNNSPTVRYFYMLDLHLGMIPPDSTPLRNTATGGLDEKNRLPGCSVPPDWQRLWWWRSCCRRLSTAVPLDRSTPDFAHDNNQGVHFPATHNQIQAQHRCVYSGGDCAMVFHNPRVTGICPNHVRRRLRGEAVRRERGYFIAGTKNA